MPPSPDSGTFAITVRRFHPVEFDALERFNPKTLGVHRIRLGWQARGLGLYLGAWLDERPVGHVWLEWVPEHDGAASRPIDCPRLVDLYVVAQLRSRGIGTRLIAAAEQAAAERGHRCVGLDVGLDNPRAYALYARLGYVDAGLGRFWISWQYVDAEGRMQREGEECVYLVHRLRSAAGPSRLR
ncbi:MAG TPA: GNAT family N-acetyltransferase [Thermomicrobiaceae bacterium]|nr:GNAT family N-acetyltransferase [Thermomicrobiaceae bacterium]